MNQDFTGKKKQYLSEKEKFVQRGSPKKKIPAQAVSEKKNVQPENSPPPPPPITFLMVRPLGNESLLQRVQKVIVFDL